MIDEQEVYFYYTAENEYEKAVKYSAQGRRAKAQEALQEAKFWIFKCNAYDSRGLGSLIETLERQLHL